MDVDSAYDLIERAIASGRQAAGYMVVGDVRGEALELSDRILRKLFPEATDQIANRTHPDVAYLEPEGKSRSITVESIRRKIVDVMDVTSFSGGWKAGVIVGADRMNVQAANAFLKTLEEPPPKTIFLLLTDSPESLLPTIVSRTQRIDLTSDGGYLGAEELGDIAAAVKHHDAYKLVAILSELEEAAPEEEAPSVRKAFFQAIMEQVRCWMVSGRLERYRAFRNVEAVEDAYRQLGRNIKADAVLSQLADRLICA